MNPKIAKYIVRIIAAITCAFGFLSIYLSLVIFTPAAFRSGNGAFSLLFALPLVAFGGYIVYLSYQLSFRLSRDAFKRLYFGFVIILAVIVTDKSHLSGFTRYLIPISLGLIGVFTRPFVSNRLFPENH